MDICWGESILWKNFYESQSNSRTSLVVKNETSLKEHKLLDFLCAFFLKISETLIRLISLEKKQISTNGEKLTFQFSTVFHIGKYKNLKNFYAYAH